MRDKEMLAVCYELANQSPCAKMKFGSVVVKDGEIVGRGFNHSPNPDCDDCEHLCAGGIRVGVASGTRLELCHAAHAEQWALLEAGNLAQGATVYVAGFSPDGKAASKDPSLPLGHPKRGFYCTFCIRLIWAGGCAGIVCDSVNGPFHQSLAGAWATSFGVAEAGK